MALTIWLNPVNTSEQIELQDSWLAITVLKQQYLKELLPTGGLKETQVYTTNIVYPEWTIGSPLKCLKLTQNYYYYHKALDLIPKCNNYNIFVIDSGDIIFSGWQTGYGNRIEVQHKNGFISTYSHLSKTMNQVGDQVNKGDVIGIMGSTGRSTGPHLHFELIYGGIKLNPMYYLKKYLYEK